jgi:uncharacterized protein (TIGR03663 family)
MHASSRVDSRGKRTWETAWRHRAPWLVLAVLAALTRLWDLGDRALSHDESLQVYYAWRLAVGGEASHHPSFHGPLLQNAAALIFIALGASDLTARLFPAASGVLLVLSPALMRRYLGERGALAAACMLLVSPTLLFYSRSVRPDVPMLLSLAIQLAAIMHGLAGSRRAAYVLALSTVMAVAARELAWIHLAITTTFLLGCAISGPGRLRLPVALGCVLAAIIAALAAHAILVSSSLDRLANTTLASGVPAVAGAAAILLPVGLGLVCLPPDAAAGARRALARVTWRQLCGALALGTIGYAVLFSDLGRETPAIMRLPPLGWWAGVLHEGARGDNPWYYYVTLASLYEFLPLSLGGLATLYYAARARPQKGTAGQPACGLLVPLLVAWWTGMIWTLSLYPQRMPWLTMHFVVPLALLGGAWVDDYVASNRQRVMRLPVDC